MLNLKEDKRIYLKYEEIEKNYEAINIKWLKKEIEDGEFIE